MAGETVVSRDPYRATVVWEGPAAGPQEVARAVAAARAAAPGWSATPVAERSEALRRFADGVEAGAGALSDLIVREVGKLRRDAEGEVAWTARTARWYAEHPPAVERRGGAEVVRRPVGVVAAITPWNVPLVTPAWKWLPALVAGNTVVWKPSELSTGVAAATLGLMREAGIGPGVLELLPGGAGTGRLLSDHPDVAGILFTGSTAAGAAIGRAAAGRLARCQLEMSGHNAAVVFSDADLALAADCIAACATSLAGQKCTATRRVFVDRAVASALTGLLSERFSALVPGDPADDATTLGPLISPRAAARASRAVAESVAAGARVIARSPPPLSAGGSLAPAILLDGLARGDVLRREEVFAPVVWLEAFGRDEEAWALADATDFGLSAAVYTSDRKRIAGAAANLRSGVVAVNRRGDDVDLEAPFAGLKSSGNGFPEGGEYAYAAVTDTQAVYGAG